MVCLDDLIITQHAAEKFRKRTRMRGDYTEVINSMRDLIRRGKPVQIWKGGRNAASDAVHVPGDLLLVLKGEYVVTVYKRFHERLWPSSRRYI